MNGPSGSSTRISWPWPRIAHVGAAADLDRHAGGAPSFTTPVASLRHLGEHGVDRGGIEGRRAARSGVRTTSKAIGARRKPTAEPTPAPAGISTSAMPSFSARRAACSGAPPPKAIRVRPSQLGAALDGVDAGGVGHVLFDDLGDAERRHGGVELERPPTWVSSAAPAQLGVEQDRAAGEAVGIDAAQHDVGVGHGGLACRRAGSRRGRDRSRRSRGRR